jgi:hypothetical protein
LLNFNSNFTSKFEWKRANLKTPAQKAGFGKSKLSTSPGDIRRARFIRRHNPSIFCSPQPKHDNYNLSIASPTSKNSPERFRILQNLIFQDENFSNQKQVRIEKRAEHKARVNELNKLITTSEIRMIRKKITQTIHPAI